MQKALSPLSCACFVRAMQCCHQCARGRRIAIHPVCKRRIDSYSSSLYVVHVSARPFTLLSRCTVHRALVPMWVPLPFCTQWPYCQKRCTYCIQPVHQVSSLPRILPKSSWAPLCCRDVDHDAMTGSLVRYLTSAVCGSRNLEVTTVFFGKVRPVVYR